MSALLGLNKFSVLREPAIAPLRHQQAPLYIGVQALQ